MRDESEMRLGNSSRKLWAGWRIWHPVTRSYPLTPSWMIPSACRVIESFEYHQHPWGAQTNTSSNKGFFNGLVQGKNLQETIHFPMKHMGFFACKFSLEPIRGFFLVGNCDIDIVGHSDCPLWHQSFWCLTTSTRSVEEPMAHRWLKNPK